jgi:hypothetical protein
MRALPALAIGAMLAAAAPGHPLRDRVDRSFSAIPLGTMRAPARLGLRELRQNGCHRYTECDWADARGVRHYFWEANELVVKTIRARDMAGREISALGIGRARTRAQVLARVRTFLPRVAISCEHEEAQPEAGDADPPVTFCGATLDEGWIRIWFDAADQLTEVRLDARHFV